MRPEPRRARHLTRLRPTFLTALVDAGYDAKRLAAAVVDQRGIASGPRLAGFIVVMRHRLSKREAVP
jgi:hypothetical protein